MLLFNYTVRLNIVLEPLSDNMSGYARVALVGCCGLGVGPCITRWKTTSARNIMACRSSRTTQSWGDVGCNPTKSIPWASW
jgi:hypothetical protein